LSSTSIEGTGLASWANVDALGDDSRIGAGVAQLDAQIKALAARKTLARKGCGGIVELLSLLCRDRCGGRLAIMHLGVGGAARLLHLELGFGIVLIDDMGVVGRTPDDEAGHDRNHYADGDEGWRHPSSHAGGQSTLGQPGGDRSDHFTSPS
jgi:hypothetical protein